MVKLSSTTENGGIRSKCLRARVARKTEGGPADPDGTGRTDGHGRSHSSLRFVGPDRPKKNDGRGLAPPFFLRAAVVLAPFVVMCFG